MGGTPTRRTCTDQVWRRASINVDASIGECECDGCPHCDPASTAGKDRPHRCWKTVWRAHSNVEKMGQVDEILPRSLGGDPTDPNNCRLVCRGCHFSGPSGAHRTTHRRTHA